jgi:hypothetical protein
VDGGGGRNRNEGPEERNNLNLSCWYGCTGGLAWQYFLFNLARRYFQPSRPPFLALISQYWTSHSLQNFLIPHIVKIPPLFNSIFSFRFSKKSLK